MTRFTRRGFVLSAGSAAALTAGCGNGIGSTGAQELDARVNASMNYLYTTYPDTQDLAAKTTGILVMPLITEAGLGFGGGFGRGALRVGGVSVEYYNTTKANWGVQIGANQYAHVLFFMTEDALTNFRASDGWELGADVEAAIYDDGQTGTLIKTYYVVLHVNTPSLFARTYYKFVRPVPPMGKQWGVPLQP